MLTDGAGSELNAFTIVIRRNADFMLAPSIESKLRKYDTKSTERVQEFLFTLLRSQSQVRSSERTTCQHVFDKKSLITLYRCSF